MWGAVGRWPLACSSPSAPLPARTEPALPAPLGISLPEQYAQLLQVIGLKSALLAPHYRKPQGPVRGRQVIFPNPPSLTLTEVEPDHSTIQTNLVVQRHRVAEESN